MDLYSEIKEQMNLSESDPNLYSPLVLAYLGDGIFELVIRSLLVSRGNIPVEKLHKKATKYVKAEAQAAIMHGLKGSFSDKEWEIYRRGRNAKSYSSAKNASIMDYRIATGFEALMGYLYLSKNSDRMMEIIKKGMEIIDGEQGHTGE